MSRRTRELSTMRHKGFTLVELMATIAVAALVLALAAPSFASLIQANRLTAAANEMVALLQSAKSASLSQRSIVDVCPSVDGTTCVSQVGNRWVAVMDKDGVKTVLRDTTIANAITIKTSAAVQSASNRLRFNSDGFGRVAGRIGFCSATLSGSNAIDVASGVGRVSTERRDATSACTAPQDL